MKRTEDDARTALYDALTDIDDHFIEEATQAPAASEKRTPKARVMRRWIAAAACLCVVLVTAAGLSAAGLAPIGSSQSGDPAQQEAPAPAGESAPAEQTQQGSAHFASDYEEVLAALKDRTSAFNSAYSAKEVDAAEDIGYASMESAATDAAASTTLSLGAQADHSETNVQVEGIDEGDIMETDGRFIYRLTGNQVYVFAAQGADTKEVASILLTPENSQEKANLANYWNSCEMYLNGDQLTVVGTVDQVQLMNGGSDPASAPAAIPENSAASTTCETIIDLAPYARAKDHDTFTSTMTVACVFNVADPAHPTLIHQLAQDGAYRTSRLSGSTLTLITNQYVWTQLSDAVKADQLEAFIPRAFAADNSALYVPAENIQLLDTQGDRWFEGYAVIGRYDTNTGQNTDLVALLDGADTVYMSANALYTAQTCYANNPIALYGMAEFGDAAEAVEAVEAVEGEEDEDAAPSGEEPAPDPALEEIDEPQDVIVGSSTTVTKFALVDNKMQQGISVDLPGQLLNQFSLDEYQGYLRIAMHDDRYVLQPTVEEIEDTPQTNSLYVLDGSLQVVGLIDHLAPGEEIKSVRFDGPIGYVCTFKEIDPLFAVDLADPQKPTVLSALKIPGFSSYLHPFGPGLLLGIGQSVQDDRTTGLKLSMFDTSDPTNVREIASLPVKGEYSEALYNHKAVLVSVEKGLIGLPVENGYALFSYSQGKGFKPLKLSDQGKALMGDESYYVDSVRGVFCGDDLYLCSDWILAAYGLSTGDLLTSLQFADPDHYGAYMLIE